MSCNRQYNFCVAKGATFQPTIRWGSPELTSKAITGITQAMPAVVTAIGHSVPDGWPVAIVSAKGMTQANAAHNPPSGQDWHDATLLTADTLRVEGLNTAGYSAYTSGGYLVYKTPVDISAAAFTMDIKDSPENGVSLLTLASSPAAGISVDSGNRLILPTFETAALTWDTGYYTLLAVIAGVSTVVAEGVIRIS